MLGSTMASDKRWNTIITPRRWLISLENAIDSYIERGDSINVWGVPSTGTSSQLRKLTNNPDSKILFVFVDTQWLSSVSSESFFELLNSHLVEQVSSEVANQMEKLTPMMQTQRLLTTITKDQNICIIIDSIEELSGLDKTFFSSIKALRDKYFSHLCFIFVSNRPLYDHRDFQDNEEFIDFACHRELIATPLKEKESAKEVERTLEYFKTSLTPEKRRRIASATGGSLGLLKSLLRVVELDPERDIDEKTLLEEPAIRNRINRICEIMTDEEIDYLIELAKGKPPQTKITPFLKKSGLVSNGTIQGSLLKQAIIQGCPEKRTNQRTTSMISDSDIPIPTKGLAFDFISGEIFKDGKRLPEVLSKSETKIMKIMQDEPGRLISREEVGQTIWTNDTEEKYSEWAIDKTISRIRQKIGDSQRPYRYLITIKGRGFKLYLDPK